MPDFLPRRHSIFLQFAQNFSDRLSADPEIFGVSPQRAAELADACQTLAEDYKLATEPATATVGAVAAKDASRRRVSLLLRKLNFAVRGNATRPELLIALGLKPRQSVRSRFPRPTAPPMLAVVRTIGRSVELRLSDLEAPTRVAKPRGIVGATILSWVGEQLPPSVYDWRFHSMPRRTRTTVEFEPDLPPGTKVWLTASWRSTRDEDGPRCQPVFTHLGAAGPGAQKPQAA